eukprot:GHVU01000298.1.p2 GENE.GHVU01000298.1~~GHVU01000298.1.p2  ORF type:complete len:110 (+),score=20.27 GHVU01000298.1:35-331(+)
MEDKGDDDGTAILRHQQSSSDAVSSVSELSEGRPEPVPESVEPVGMSANEPQAEVEHNDDVQRHDTPEYFDNEDIPLPQSSDDHKVGKNKGCMNNSKE